MIVILPLPKNISCQSKKWLNRFSKKPMDLTLFAPLSRLKNAAMPSRSSSTGAKTNISVSNGKKLIGAALSSGIEEGEDVQATALREIAEETGYTSAQFVRSLGGTVHAQYYQLNKQENRWAHFEGFLFQLKNGDKKEVAQEEKDIQDAHWISKNDVENFLSWVEDMKLLWHRVLTDDAFGGEGIVVNSGEFNGLSTTDARTKIIARLEELGVGNYETQFKLRDWVFSRQRYWGEPIPLVFCEACAKHPDENNKGEMINPGWIPTPTRSFRPPTNTNWNRARRRPMPALRKQERPHPCQMTSRCNFGTVTTNSAPMGANTSSGSCQTPAVGCAYHRNPGPTLLPIPTSASSPARPAPVIPGARTAGKTA
jgi:ADP-ribose pyrophosphatase YjhB (NUDIX family)